MSDALCRSLAVSPIGRAARRGLEGRKCCPLAARNGARGSTVEGVCCCVCPVFSPSFLLCSCSRSPELHGGSIASTAAIGRSLPYEKSRFREQIIPKISSG
jgi:hypothetical protein